MVRNKGGFSLIEVLISFSIICIFLLTSYTLARQVLFLTVRGKDYYEICNLAQNIAEEIKSNHLSIDDIRLELSPAVLMTGFSFTKGQYHIEVSGEKIATTSNRYLIKINTSCTNTNNQFLLFTSFYDSEGYDYKGTHDEIVIEEWEMFE